MRIIGVITMESSIRLAFIITGASTNATYIHKIQRLDLVKTRIIHPARFDLNNRNFIFLSVIIGF